MSNDKPEIIKTNQLKIIKYLQSIYNDIYFNIKFMNLNQRNKSQRANLLIELLRRQLSMFIKSLAEKQQNLQSKREKIAASYNNNVLEVFNKLDLNKKGYIDNTDLQIFLINHKYYFHQNLIHKYMEKHAQNKQYLTIAEFFKIVLPRNKYELLSFNIRYKQSNNLCTQIQTELLFQDTSRLLAQQLNTLKFFIDKKNECIKYSLRNGTNLWRIIDKEYKNVLTYQNVGKMICSFGIQFSQRQWCWFLNYCTQKGKKFLNKEQFLLIFNPQKYQKETFQIEMKKLSFPFQKNRVQLQIQQNYQKQDLQKRKQRIHLYELMHDKILDKSMLYTTGLIQFNKSNQQKVDILRQTSKSTLRKIIRQEHLPVCNLNTKILMNYKNLGYNNTKNHIKAYK